MSMDPIGHAPAFEYSRKRIESRRLEGPGRSEYIITHRHGSEYQKQSVFASAQHQSLPSRYKSHGHDMLSYDSASPIRPPRRRGPMYQARQRDFHQHDHYGETARRRPRLDEEFARHTHRERRARTISSSSMYSSRDISDMDERSPRGLAFGISLARSNKDKNSSVSLTQASETSFGHNGVKGSKNNKTYKESIFSVSSSRYTNSLDLGMSIGAELVLQPPPRPTEKSLSPLLTWIHLEGEKHTIDSFEAYVTSMNGLPDEEKYKARNLLKDVKHYEKPLQTSQGMQSSYVEAVCSHIEPEDVKKDESQVVFLCLPYFELASLSKQSPSRSRGTHQLRTLLQYSHGHTSKSGDLQQAVCHLDQVPKGHCFHISYLWCLVIGSDILITCSNLSPPKIQQDRITTKTPSDSQSAQEPRIRVSDDIGRVWLLPVKDCTTWLEFAAHFRFLSTNLHKDYEIVFQGAVQDPANWHFVIKRAFQKTLNLSIQLKPSLINFPHGKKSSRLRRSAYSEDSDDDNPNSSMSAADKISLANATDIAQTAAIGVNVHQPVDSDSKGLDTERHAPVRAEFPKFDSDGIQIARVQEPYIFLRAVFVLKKPDVPDKEIGKAEKVAHPARAPQSAADIHSFRYDTQRLKRIFEDMDNRLRSKKVNRSRVYKKCSSRTFQEVETRSMQILREGEMASQKKTKVSSENVENTSSTPPDPDEEDAGTSQAQMQTKRSRSPVVGVPLRGNDETEMPEIETKSEERPVAPTKLDLERQKRFLKLAKALFRYFLPLEFNSALVAKYWGAVYVLIEDPVKLFVASKIFHSGGQWEMDIIEALVIFSGDRTQGTAPPPWRIDVPDIYGDAWLHLVMGLVLSTDWHYAGEKKAFEEFEAFRVAVIQGKTEILQNLAPDSLEEKQAVLSLGAISIVIWNLVNNGVPGQPDTTPVYLEYLDRLVRQQRFDNFMNKSCWLTYSHGHVEPKEHEVERNPYHRLHQEKLLYFRDEVFCIQKVLHDQLERIRDIKNIYWRSKPLRSSSNDQAILKKCMQSAEERIVSFEMMNSRAINIGTYNIQRIEATKDRQEAAILVFTAVTIIFLPLSFMSSLFGMNTYDIRNMGTRQWVFWATAIPVTIIVVGFAVVAVLYIDPVRGFWARIAERHGSRRIVRVMDEED